MTDFTTAAPLSIRSLKLPRFALPKLAVGAALAGLSKAVGGAFEMAFVAPFSGDSSQPRVVSGEAEDGRDPNW